MLRMEKIAIGLRTRIVKTIVHLVRRDTSRPEMMMDLASFVETDAWTMEKFAIRESRLIVVVRIVPDVKQDLLRIPSETASCVEMVSSMKVRFATLLWWPANQIALVVPKITFLP